jgi:spermidine/putrescine transport system substrate-binding protein
MNKEEKMQDIPAEIRPFLTRRRVLQAGAIGGAAAVAAACGAGGSTTEGSAPAAESVDKSETDKKVVWSNWQAYMPLSEEDASYPDLVAFTAETGIEVSYTEDYNDNNEAYAKYKPLLDKGQSLGVDIVTPTDWMADLWIQNGYAMKFDDANIPNKANLNEAYKNVSWDPGRSFSLPWQSGFAGFGWNKAKLKETLGTDKLTSMEQFFDPKLKGKVIVLSELRDTIPLVLSWQGNDPTNFGDDEFQKAMDFLQSKVDDGHIQAFTGNEYIKSLEGGDVTAVIAWSGDIGQMGPEYGFDLPETGGSIFVDNVLIPAGAEHKANAEKIINYFYDPVVAARVAAYVQYISPVNGAAEELLKTDPALADNPLIFPPDELLKRAYSAMSFTPEQAAKYSAAWSKLLGT